jgi:hypothetical protein
MGWTAKAAAANAEGQFAPVILDKSKNRRDEFIACRKRLVM